jgi:hypothetical protein
VQVVAVLKSEYVGIYMDVRYWLLVALKGAAERASAGLVRGQVTQNLLRLLMLVTVPPTEEDMRDFWVPLTTTTQLGALGDAQQGGGTDDEEEEGDGDVGSALDDDDDDDDEEGQGPAGGCSTPMCI